MKSSDFAGRKVEQHITDEFLSHYTNINISNEEEAIEIIRNAARRVEQNFNCVAEVTYGKYGYKVRMIRTMDADQSVLERAQQNILYWIEND